MKKNCFLFNVGPHYRFPIYNLIGKKIDCDIYFGDHMNFPLKIMDFSRLPSFKKLAHNVFIGPFYWQRGALSLLGKGYQSIVTTGDVYCISTWFLLLLSKFKGIKIISWTHGLYGNETFLKRWLKTIYYSLHDIILTYNEYGKKQTMKVGISSNKVFCIANSMDTDADRQLRKELKYTSIYKDHFKNDYPTIIYCGRIQKIKKLDMLIMSVFNLNKLNQNSNLILVGKDVDNVNLDLLVKQFHLENNVWLFGPCYDESKLSELFYNASVCVSPGNVGLTAIHSLSFGCPVITNNDFANQMPEFEAITPGQSGDFFEKDNQSDLDNKLKCWLNKNSQERYKIVQDAFNTIDSKWNIYYQLDVLTKVLNN